MLRRPKFHISINYRLTYLTLLILLIAGTLVARLFYLQILQYNMYFELAKNQQQSASSLLPERGNIYFREDKTDRLITVATTQKGYLLYVDTRTFKGSDEVFQKINSITSIDKTIFDQIIKKINDPYEILKQRVSLNDGDKIKALKITGIGLEPRSWRFYPGDTMASHVLGFVSSVSDNMPRGQYGIEKFYESKLRGEGSSSLTEKDAGGILLVFNNKFDISSRDGNDVVLTIEPSVQLATEDELKQLKDDWNPVSGGIIIVEPKTGKIRALAAFPNFNPNEYNKEKKLDVFLNPFIEKTFELGSVFKPLTIAAALDQGVLTPETTYVDKGQIKINGQTISNFDGKARGLRTMTQVLEESLNTGAIFAMQKLGQEKFKEYFHNYGLGEKLNIDLSGELAGNLNNLNDWREVYYATASFGQGIAVTPLELTMALSALGNGGELLRPNINEEREKTVIRRVLKAETSQTITRMLVDVVDVALLGGQAKKTDYSIAAKTGTAQLLNKSGDSTYASDQFLHSFFGYFPAYDPRFLIFIFLERPRGVEYASHSLTNSFSTLVDFLINYYTIPPDRN
ncbi:MAG: penicillin-binding protein 2 [Patescibacteria group bacterium]